MADGAPLAPDDVNCRRAAARSSRAAVFTASSASSACRAWRRSRLLPRRIFLGLAPRALGSVMLVAAMGFGFLCVRGRARLPPRAVASSARLARARSSRAACVAGRRVALGDAASFGLGHRRGRGVLLGRLRRAQRLVHLAQDPCARFGGRLVLRPRRDLLELGAIR